MRIAIWIINVMGEISLHRYNELVEKREQLVKDRARMIHPKHIKMIDEQLNNIRKEISDAHRAKYKANFK